MFSYRVRENSGKWYQWKLLMIQLRIFILSCITILHFSPVVAQRALPYKKPPVLSDTLKTLSFERLSCKNWLWIPKDDIVSPVTEKTETNDRNVFKPTIHGSVSYDFLYRSRLDTPFKMNDFYQHTIRMNLQILYKGKVPLNISTGLRVSNSPFFRNFLDLGLRFDAASYTRKTRLELIQKLTENLPEKRLIDSLTLELKRQLNTLGNFKKGYNNSMALQLLVEEKEKILHHDKAGKGYESDEVLNYLRSGHSLQELVRKAKMPGLETPRQQPGELLRKIDMIVDSSKRVRDAIEKNKQLLAKKSADIRQNLNQASGIKEMKALLPHNISDSLDKWYWRLASLKSLDIGRGYLDYSELTAKDVMITGIQAEYNPSWYGAFALGKIDYHFRDFINGPQRDHGQYLAIGRFGMGNINKKAVILTVFKGLKSQAMSFIEDSLQKTDPVLGYAIESRMSLGPQTNFRIEVAKSIKQQTFRSDKNIGSLFQFDDLSNMGIRIEAESQLAGKGTRIKGYYKRTGENFQSFNYFSYRTNRTAWLASVDQPLFQRKVSISAMIRQNDFINPEAEQTFKSTTVFKSFFLKMRLRHLPYISLGYYPGVQYFITEDRKLLQNAYNILNGTATYSFGLKGIDMSSTLSFNSYFNKATDSGFRYYKGKDYFVSHSIFTASWNLRGSYNLHDHPDLKFYSIELSTGLNFNKSVSLRGSVQYNKVNSGNSCYGYTADISMVAGIVGTVRMLYSKSYYPGPDQILFPIETGSVGLYKNF